MLMRQAKCRGPNCGAEIRWVRSRKYVDSQTGKHKGGKPVCLDAEPNPEGNVVVGPGDDGEPEAVVLSNEDAPLYKGEKWMPHWKTCPDRNDFRKKKRSVPRPAIFLLSQLVLLGCVFGETQADTFEWWTRKYEVRMGLEERTEIRVGRTPDGSCGHVAYENQLEKIGTRVVLVTWFDPEKGCDPWDVAKRQACHRRMQHHRMDLDREVVVAEVQQCERWYE
jgi:hypothetical protein